MTKPRVALVTPPSEFLLDERVFVSLGILRVGAVLERDGYVVDHLDLNGVGAYEEAVRTYVESCAADTVFAITATTPQVPAAVHVREAIGPGRHVVLGGPHATLVNAAARKGNERAKKSLAHLLETFSTVVAGDGEKAIFRALRERGLVDADDPANELWMTKPEYAEYPWPARHLVDMSTYHYEVDGHRALSLIAQLGCPFECAFCGGRNSPTLRRVRTRPSENVVAELAELHETYGVDGMMFLDDEQNVNPRVVDLMRQIKGMGIDWRLRGFVKAELFTEEQAQVMYDAGFRWLLCGFESAHPRILRNINKKATLEDNTRMLRIAHRAGLKVKALMSFGHPGESEETMMATRDWLLAERPDDFDVTTISVYPGTPYNDAAKDVEEKVCRYETNGDVLWFEPLDFTKEVAYYKGIPGEYKAFVWTDYVTRERIVELRDEVEDEVRRKLGLAYPRPVGGVQYEASMGQLPGSVLRRGKG